MHCRCLFLFLSRVFNADGTNGQLNPQCAAAEIFLRALRWEIDELKLLDQTSFSLGLHVQGQHWAPAALSIFHRVQDMVFKTGEWPVRRPTLQNRHREGW